MSKNKVNGKVFMLIGSEGIESGVEKNFTKKSIEKYL